MTASTPLPPILVTQGSDRAISLALRLAQAEDALDAFTAGQVDAIVDSDGRIYLLRTAQEHLRQSEERLKAVIDNAADVITVINRGGIILSQSRASQRVLGYEANALVGQSFFQFVHKEDHPEVYFAFFEVIEGFHESATVRFRHRDTGDAFRMIEATVARLGPGPDSSVVFSLRRLTGEPDEISNPSQTPDGSNQPTTC